MEQEAEERAEAEGRLDAGTDDDGLSSAERAKEARREERRKARKEAESARRHNLAVGRALVGRHGAKGRREHGLARAKALVYLLLSDNENLPAQGLRLVMEQLQEAETKTVKATGEKVEQVSYADPADCLAYAWKKVEEARTKDEVLELAADLMIAAELSDDTALPRSRRLNFCLSGGEAMKEALSEEIKAVRPRSRRRR